jgi:Tol biopolymer transport system component
MNGNPSRSRERFIAAAVFVVTLMISGCTTAQLDADHASAQQRVRPVAAGSEVVQSTLPAEPQAIFEPAPEPMSSLLVEDTHFQPQPPPPSVNVFGELDGRPRDVARTIGEVGFQQHTYLSEGHDGDVAVDPTGRWIAFSSTRHGPQAQVYLQRADGLSVTQLTSDASDNAFPCFSPDGSRIAFSSTRSGNWDIYVMDRDGTNVVQITSGSGHELHPSFSPDGTRLVYSSVGGQGGQWELWTANLGTSERRMIGFGLFPAWSPDTSRDRIAFQRARQRGGRWYSLWTLDLVDGEARNVTEVAVSSNAAIVSPAWSPDGRKLAFSTIVDPARHAARGRTAGQQDVWTVNADGSNRRRLTDGTGTNATPFWSADNRVYFVSNRNGTECVWSVQADAPNLPVARTKETAAPQPPALGSSDTGDASK